MKAANPFVDFGQPISGARFIGRVDELSLIQSRIFGDLGFGSLAVVGLPKIGKSSLVSQAIEEARPSAESLRIAILPRLDIGAYATVSDLFRAIIDALHEELLLSRWLTDRLASAITRGLSDPNISFSLIRMVFREVRKTGIRVVCILDEFDAGRYLFTGNPQVFHWLRELCSNPEFKAAIVIISKRPLEDVARIAGHESDYWANVLMRITLRPFSEPDAATFFATLQRLGIETRDAAMQEVRALCGRHPFLLDAYAYYAWQHKAVGADINVDWVRREISNVAQQYYKTVATILNDLSMLNKFAEATIGPQWTLTKNDLDNLSQYGILSRDNGNLVSFADGFEEFVRFVESPSEIWPLWHKTESSLRLALENLLQRKYGTDWIQPLKTARPNLREMLEDRERLMVKERHRFGQRAASSLLAYTYPMDLYQIMRTDWPTLGVPLLGSDRDGWSIKFNLLSKIRTPLAHNRGEVIDEADRRQAEGFCMELSRRIEVFSAK